MDKNKLILGVTAIGCVTFLETINLVYVGIDGGVLTAVVSGILGIVGLIIGRKSSKG